MTIVAWDPIGDYDTAAGTSQSGVDTGHVLPVILAGRACEVVAVGGSATDGIMGR